MDPFRDGAHAALVRVARLEEENARLRRELAETFAPIRPGRGRRAPLVALGVLGVMALVAGWRHKAGSAPSVVVSVQVPAPPTSSAPPPPPDWHKEARVTASDVHAVEEGAEPAVAYAVGSSGTILRHYAQAERGWTQEVSGTSHDLFGVADFLGHVCAVGASGVATCTGDPTRPRWKVERTGTSKDLLGIGTVDASFLAVGRGGVIIRRDFQGGPWVAEASGTTTDLFSVSEADLTPQPDAVGARGTILHRRENGTWSPVPSGTTEDLFSVGADMETVVVVGAHGTILRLTDPREGFEKEKSGTARDLFGVSHGISRGFLAVGANGTLLRSNAANEWVPETGGGDGDLFGVQSCGGTSYAVGTLGTILSVSS